MPDEEWPLRRMVGLFPGQPDSARSHSRLDRAWPSFAMAASYLGRARSDIALSPFPHAASTLLGLLRSLFLVATCSTVGLTCLVALNGSQTTLSIAAWIEGCNLMTLAAAIAAFGFFAHRRQRNNLREPPSQVDERQEFADALPHVLWGTTADGRCEFLNERYTETFGIPRLQAIRDQSWVDPIHPADRPKMYQAWRLAVENGSASYSAHARVCMNDGSYRWMESRGRSVSSPKSGEVVKWFGSLIDVQSQVELQETIARLQFDMQTVTDECEMALGRAEERFQKTFDSREMGWIEYEIRPHSPTLDGLGLHTSTSIREFLEKHPAAAHELRRLISITRASERTISALGYADFSQMVSGWAGIAGTATLDVEIAILNALHDQTPTSCGIAELLDAEGKRRAYPFALWIMDSGIARVAFFDASETIERTESLGAARQHLAKANRIASATALSASLVHEISQPITAISLDLATATRLAAATDTTDTEALSKVMERLRWNTQRLTEIGKRTRESLRPGRLGREALDLHELIAQCRDLLIEPLSGKAVSVSITADGELPLIVADPVALKQVVCALIQNALESANSREEAPSVSVWISRATRSRDLRVKIADRGVGVKEEHLAMVFDPFFTTKPNRLGFGLTVAQAVVEGFGGRLRLYNRREGGTAVEFSIPTGELQ